MTSETPDLIDRITAVEEELARLRQEKARLLLQKPLYLEEGEECAFNANPEDPPIMGKIDRIWVGPHGPNTALIAIEVELEGDYDWSAFGGCKGWLM